MPEDREFTDLLSSCVLNVKITYKYKTCNYGWIVTTKSVTPPRVFFARARLALGLRRHSTVMPTSARNVAEKGA
jgi:hypothetical protein